MWSTSSVFLHEESHPAAEFIRQAIGSAPAIWHLCMTPLWGCGTYRLAVTCLHFQCPKSVTANAWSRVRFFPLLPSALPEGGEHSTDYSCLYRHPEIVP
jgi:hypothetical protein